MSIRISLRAEIRSADRKDNAELVTHQHSKTENDNLA